MSLKKKITGLPLACIALLASTAWATGYFENKNYPIVTDEIFTADEFIMDQAKFWYAIYTEVAEDEGLIHDPFYPDLVFKKVHAPGTGRSASKAVEVQVNAQRQEIREMLALDSASRTPEQRNLKARFPAFWDSTAITLCVDRLRFQRGLKSKFRAGLERSYRYLPLIESTLTVHNVPGRLKYLPHVESSFYPFAYSKVGAAGMWQFMKSSARQYSVKVSYQIDNRRDPYASTEAAARMLAGNFRILKSWPLAIVAYNHGPGGLARATRSTGTRDLGTIIKTYYSDSFGFASKNFYAEFLAASSIGIHADSLFPDLQKMEPLRFQTLVLAKATGTKSLCNLTGLSPDVLEEYNLGLRPATFRGNSQLPKGYALRLPEAIDLASLTVGLGSGNLLAKAEVTAAAASAPVARSQSKPVAAPQDKVENASGSEKPAKPVPAKTKSPVRVAKISESDIASIRASEPEVPVKLPPPPAAMPVPEARIIDSTLALQTSDLDKLAHPLDRFNPEIYRLDHAYADGYLKIRVGTEETLSHYAEWAGVSETILRRLNSLRGSKGMQIGRSIRIPLDADKAKDFVLRREENYRAIEEDFYSNYYVSLLERVGVEKGMNLWNWAQEKEIPFWLLQKHNAGKSLRDIHPGDTLNLPIIETGIRKWGFTRYGSSQDYLAGIARFISTGKPEAY